MTSAIATVTQGGSPLAGQTVTFSSSNANATVNPATGVTDASGEATTIVTAVSDGDATITATANGVIATALVRTPDMGPIALAVLMALMLAMAAFMRRREASVG